jgi:hypothetical protein
MRTAAGVQEKEPAPDFLVGHARLGSQSAVVVIAAVVCRRDDERCCLRDPSRSRVWAASSAPACRRCSVCHRHRQPLHPALGLAHLPPRAEWRWRELLSGVHAQHGQALVHFLCDPRDMLGHVAHRSAQSFKGNQESAIVTRRRRRSIARTATRGGRDRWVRADAGTHPPCEAI